MTNDGDEELTIFIANHPFRVTFCTTVSVSLSDMKKVYFIAIFIVLFLQSSFAFEKPKPAKKDTSHHNHFILSVGGGFIYTSLNFFKNYQEETYYTGRGFRVMAQFNNRFRICVSRDQVNSIDILPVWLHVKNIYYDIDAHFISNFRTSNNTAYFILGTSTQYWSGFYTGINDVNRWKLNIPLNSNYKTMYYGLTVGVGLEIRLYKPLSMYGEFRFRVSKTDLGAGINDVLYGGGLKLNIPTPKRKTGARHHSILKFRDKYHWF
jgi:hypothetical protein